jgi:hypothetical protein
MAAASGADIAGHVVTKPHGRVQSGWHALSVSGEVLILQLLFVLASLPLVTVLPAAVALQRSLHQLVVLKTPRPAENFILNLRWSLRRFWLAGLLAPLAVTAITGAGLFWWSATTPVRWIALVVVCCAGGLALVGYLALLAAAATTPTESRFKDVGRAALHLVRRGPLALAAALVLHLVWLALAVRFPTILLVGSGLVPAGIIWFVVDRPASRDHA